MKQNYINRLQDENKALRQMVEDLRRYVRSDKFFCGDALDGYVNVKDVLNRTDLSNAGL